MSPEPRRIAQIVRLKRESLQAYKECHDAVWPAVLQQIKDCNIVDYSIFLDDQSMTLYATMKYVGDDYDADMEKMKANPKVREWWYDSHVQRKNHQRRPRADLCVRLDRRQMTDGMQETLVDGAQGSTDPKGW